MKILFNTYYHAFQNPGGGEIVLHKTREYLQNHGVTVDLFNQWNTKISDYDLIHNFSTLNYRDWDGFKTYCPKLIVTPTIWPSTTPIDIAKERIRTHIKNFSNMNSSEVNFISALARVDKFFPTTNMEKDKICQRFNLHQDRFKVIYNGVDLPQAESSTNLFKEKFNLSHYFLFVGRISPLKNVHKIIEAANISGNKLVLIGGADKLDENYYIQLKNNSKNNSNIVFIEPLPNNSTLLSDAYYGASALIVASEFETCSLVGLEAGVRGTPVIMTSRGATSEVYKDFVNYLNPHHDQTIVDAFSINWNQEKRDRLKNFIASSYSWNQIALNIKNEYLEILKK